MSRGGLPPGALPRRVVAPRSGGDEMSVVAERSPAAVAARCRPALPPQPSDRSSLGCDPWEAVLPRIRPPSSQKEARQPRSKRACPTTECHYRGTVGGIVVVCGEDAERAVRRGAAMLLRRPHHSLTIWSAPRVAVAFCGEHGGLTERFERSAPWMARSCSASVLSRRGGGARRSPLLPSRRRPTHPAVGAVLRSRLGCRKGRDRARHRPAWDATVVPSGAGGARSRSQRAEGAPRGRVRASPRSRRSRPAPRLRASPGSEHTAGRSAPAATSKHDGSRSDRHPHDRQRSLPSRAREQS